MVDGRVDRELIGPVVGRVCSARRWIFAERDDTESTRLFLFIVLVISLQINMELSKLLSKRWVGGAYAIFCKLALALIAATACRSGVYSLKTSAANFSM